MKRGVVVALVFLLVAPVVLAGELAGVQMDDEVTVGEQTLQLNGMGLRKKLWIKVYVGGLYLEKGSSNAGEIVESEQVKKVIMHFLTDRVTKAKLDSAWNEGFEANNPDEYPALEKRVTTFMGYFGDMKVGDRIIMTFTPGEGVSVAFNDTLKGVIEGDDFSKALLRVWLGDHPPTEDLKAGMLGG
jgi:hypothetical protein